MNLLKEKCIIGFILECMSLSFDILKLALYLPPETNYTRITNTGQKPEFNPLNAIYSNFICLNAIYANFNCPNTISLNIFNAKIPNFYCNNNLFERLCLNCLDVFIHNFFFFASCNYQKKNNNNNYPLKNFHLGKWPSGDFHSDKWPSGDLHSGISIQGNGI